MNRLILDPIAGMAGDMFAAALVGLGVPAERLRAVMTDAARPIGGATVEIRQEPQPDGAVGWHISARPIVGRSPLATDEASSFLEITLRDAGVTHPYAAFSMAALGALAHAESHAHGIGGHCPETGHARAELHEAQDIIMDLTAGAWGLQWLGADLQTVECLAPVHVGGGLIRFSHGEFRVPAPATAEILAHHRIPWAHGPADFEQLTPTGAAILAALSPRFTPRRSVAQPCRRGIGLGTRRTDPPNALSLFLCGAAVQGRG